MNPIDPALASPVAGPRIEAAPGSREEAAKSFEGLFLTLLVKEMRQTLSEGGLFGEGAGSAVYEGFFDQMMADALAQGRGTGLRESILSTWPESEAAPPLPSEALSGSATAIRKSLVTEFRP